uniref:Inactive dipeptidyl peptidase 10-like n=1 Tax=Gadus morhua TaxID=8049 RepID=A0A8C5CCN2_GADMO
QSWDGSVYKANAQHNQTQLLLKNTTFVSATFKASQFALSPDLNYVLLGYDVQQVFQHSFLASYLIYNLHTREVRELNPPEVSDSVLQFASWGVRDQQLVYIFENNIYYQADVQSSSWRLTSSGQEGAVFNGISDWLYEEQVIHTQVAHWWSPDGSWLAYLSINDSLVPTMLLPHFTEGRYPKGKKYPYPKMGQINPTVKLYVIALEGGAQTAQLRPPHSFEEREHYITMVTWLTRQQVAVRWVNRAQNTSILTLCDVITAHCVKKHVMTSEKWIDRQNEEPVFSKDGTVYFITLPLKNSGGGAFNHIAMITNQSEDQEVNVRHLTSGGWEVSQVLAFDEHTDSLYFLSTEDGSAQRQLYKVSTVSPFQRSCLSCSLSKVRCTHFHARLSPRCQHVLLDCRGRERPLCQYHTVAIKVTGLQKQVEMTGAIDPYCRTLPKRNRGIVQCFLLLHSNSAPVEQLVSDRFLLDWDSVLVSSDNVVVARLDGRGSGFQGQRVLHELHQRLGTVDVQDQISAVEYLFQLPYIDRNRVGVYGKVGAYGGFLSTALLLSNQSPFRCAASVSPVINWRLYGRKVSVYPLIHTLVNSPIDVMDSRSPYREHEQVISADPLPAHWLPAAERDLLTLTCISLIYLGS